jgi:hypothetical protein
MNLECIIVETIFPACVEYFRISEQAVAIMTYQGLLQETTPRIAFIGAENFII